MILYGVVAGVAIDHLYIGGLVPGLLMVVPGPAAVSLPADDESAAAVILRDLVQKGVLLDDHWLGEGEGI